MRCTRKLTLTLRMRCAGRGSGSLGPNAGTPTKVARHVEGGGLRMGCSSDSPRPISVHARAHQDRRWPCSSGGRHPGTRPCSWLLVVAHALLRARSSQGPSPGPGGEMGANCKGGNGAGVWLRRGLGVCGQRARAGRRESARLMTHPQAGPPAPAAAPPSHASARIAPRPSRLGGFAFVRRGGGRWSGDRC